MRTKRFFFVMVLGLFLTGFYNLKSNIVIIHVLCPCPCQSPYEKLFIPTTDLDKLFPIKKPSRWSWFNFSPSSEPDDTVGLGYRLLEEYIEKVNRENHRVDLKLKFHSYVDTRNGYFEYTKNLAEVLCIEMLENNTARHCFMPIGVIGVNAVKLAAQKMDPEYKKIVYIKKKGSQKREHDKNRFGHINNFLNKMDHKQIALINLEIPDNYSHEKYEYSFSVNQKRVFFAGFKIKSMEEEHLKKTIKFALSCI